MSGGQRSATFSRGRGVKKILIDSYKYSHKGGDAVGVSGRQGSMRACRCRW